MERDLACLFGAVTRCLVVLGRLPQTMPTRRFLFRADRGSPCGPLELLLLMTQIFQLSPELGLIWTKTCVLYYFSAPLGSERRRLKGFAV